MEGIIRLLPDLVANQIAAGEVIQRPASVVKELLENAVDAGSTVVELWINEAGKKLIMVVDNGHGMSPADSRLCFERHATSKIKGTDDLFKIKTLGFRGEALASIAAIAQVELKTRRQDDELGTMIRIEGGKAMKQEPCSLTKGTTIAVKNLFFNVPARRNFLKGNNIEMTHILEEFTRVALANETVTFKLFQDGKELYHLQSGNLKQRIVSLFGGQYAQRVVPVEQPTDIVEIQGFIGKPEFSKKRRGEQYFFVNGRFFKHAYLHHAVLKAYNELIAESSIPSYFIFLIIDPSQVDVNIHPTKTEVNFLDNQSIYTILHTAVRSSLGRHNLTPMIEFEPEAGFNNYYPKNREIRPPGITINPDYNPFNSTTTEPPGGAAAVAGSSGQAKQTSLLNQRGWEKLYEDPAREIPTLPLGGSGKSPDGETNTEDTAAGANESKLIQIHQSYIITSIKSGLLIINQQYAHQRILYERFIQQMVSENSDSQQLLLPVSLEITPEETMAIADMEPLLHSMGYGINLEEEGYVHLNAIPAGMPQEGVKAVLEGLLADWVEDRDPGKHKMINTAIARAMAKRLSIKTGTALSAKEMQILTDQLFSTEQPAISPQGQPVYVVIPQTEIEERFNKRQ